MAVVATRSRQSVVSDRIMWEGIITFTGATSYATGGIPTVAADYGFNLLDNLEIMSMTGRAGTINQSAAGTFKYMLCTALPGATEIGAAGDPTGATLYVRAYGW